MSSEFWKTFDRTNVKEPQTQEEADFIKKSYFNGKIVVPYFCSRCQGFHQCWLDCHVAKRINYRSYSSVDDQWRNIKESKIYDV